MRYDFWQKDREAAEVAENGLRYRRYEYQTNGGETRYGLQMWRPKAKKPFSNYYYRDAYRRDEALVNAMSSLNADKERTARNRAERKGSPEALNQVQVGDIYHHSWGYDQTQCDFYQIVAKRGRQVTLRRIGSESTGAQGPMSENRVAVKDSFLSGYEPITKTVQFSQGKPYLSFRCGWCDKWDGKPEYCSWYA